MTALCAYTLQLARIMNGVVTSCFLINITTFLLLGEPANAQTNDPTTRPTLGIGGGVGQHILNVIPGIQNIGATAISYNGKPQKDLNGKYILLDEYGNWREFKLDAFDANAFVRVTLPGANDNGWLINAGYGFSRTSYRYSVIPFSFKGISAQFFDTGIEYHAYQVGVARYWQNFWFARINGLYYQNFTISGQDQPIEVSHLHNFTENGAGYIVGVTEQNSNRFAIMPEVGITSTKHPVEMTFSAIIPIGRYAFTEQYAYYRNRQISGEAIVTYSTFAVSATLRIGITVFNLARKTRWVHPPRSRPEPTLESSRPIPIAPDPVHVHQKEVASGRFADLPTNKPIRLQVNFDQSASALLADSFADLNELARWMQANPAAEIRLEGHTDLPGDEQQNLDLSRRRVVAVKNYVSGRGIRSERIRIAYFGASRPLNRNCPPPNFCPENRRVDMVITKR